MSKGQRVALLGARLLIAGLFVAGTAQKLIDPAPAAALLARFGLPALLVWPAAVLNAALAVALVLNWRVPQAALIAAVYCALTSLFHWVPTDPWQMSIFVKNWTIAGGCLALYAAASPEKGN